MNRSVPESLPFSGRPRPVTHGSLLQFPEDPIACMRQLHGEHGDLAVLQEDGQRIVFVFSPEFNRAVLSDTTSYHSQFFAVRGNRKSAQRRVTSGLLSQNGGEHRDTRRAMMDVFSRRVLPGYHDTICQLTHDLISGWDPGQPCDLNAEMVRFMLQMTSALLFGVDDVQYSVQLGELIDRWVHQNHTVGMGALISAPQFSQEYELLLEMAEELEVIIKQMFEKHRSRKSRHTDILSLLFKAQAGQHAMTDEQLIGHATLTFAAAHLTTAHTFSWTLMLLSQHPDVMQKLRAELDAKISGPVPTPAEIESLTYVDAVIKESMRVLPASSYSQRIAVAPVQLGPLNLPPMTPVIFSQYITHHRPDLFARPDEFLPERWDSITPSSYEYLPFGAGPRMCIGAPLAMVELRTALAMMLKAFNFQIVPDSRIDGRVISTMLGPTSSVPATLIPTTQAPECVPVSGTIHQLVQLPTSAQPSVVRHAA